MGAPVVVGRLATGVRRVVPITGGTVSGRVLPGGADVQLVRSDTGTEVEARYLLESDEGELVDPARIYVRGTPRFETASPRLARLVDHVHVGVGVRRPRAVVLDVYGVQ